MRSLPRFSADQTVFVNVLFFVCLLAGYGAYSRIPVEFFPDVNLNQAVISTVWTGASAEEVERLVTQKLEEDRNGEYVPAGHERERGSLLPEPGHEPPHDPVGGAAFHQALPDQRGESNYDSDAAANTSEGAGDFRHDLA